MRNTAELEDAVEQTSSVAAEMTSWRGNDRSSLDDSLHLS